MKNFTKIFFAILFAFTQSFTTQAQDLTLQGVLDLNIPNISYGVNGSQGKAIHVKATSSITDLSIYGIGVANNGGGTDGEEYSFPVMSVSAGDDILVARSIQAMTDYLVGGINEFEHVLLATSAISQNGNDAIELFMNSNVIETFGDVNVNPDTYGGGCGTDPTCWDYEDSWAYRTSPNTLNTFVISEWNIADVNCTDGGPSIYFNTCLYPICPPATSSLISDCGDFISGPTAWPYVLVATTVADGASSQAEQTFTMNVTSLPAGGANVRVYKTTASGGDYFGPPVALTLGSNSITVSSVTFDRTVKFQFSSGDPEFDALNLNGVNSGCPFPPPPSSLISACDEFISGPTAWPYVLVATTVADGASSQGAQTFTMNVTSLPTGGANFRVYKTTANGNDFFGPAIALTLGSNSITVSSVSFNRTVKFQFSSGDPEFNALSLNGINSGCVAPPTTYSLTMTDSWGDGWDGASWTATSTSTGTVFGPYTVTYSQGASNTETFTSADPCFTVVVGGGSYAYEHTWTLDSAGTQILSGGDPYSGSFGTCVSGCTDQNATNYDALADIDDGSCVYPPCTAPAPTHETFSTGVLPVGVCSPNQWQISATSGDGWRFTGNPGWGAGSNGRTSGEFAWIDFSGTDAGVIMEVEHVDVSSLTSSALFFDYYSDLGTYSCAANNILHVEAYDGTTWNSVAVLQLNATGWNTYGYELTGFENGTTAQVRFRGESSGLSCDYYNDLLVDDVKIMEAVYGCTDASFDNYNASANFDDGSCTNTVPVVVLVAVQLAPSHPSPHESSISKV